MANWAVEFEFVEDSGGGKFVAAGNVLAQVRSMLARGDMASATKLYEELGTGHVATLLEEAKTSSNATRQGIAEMLQMARDFANAAKLFEISGRPADAAAMYEKAGDPAAAAPHFQKAGELGKAASAYARAGRGDLALKLFEQAGDKESMAQCLGELGQFYQAATLYAQLKNVHAEVEMLRQVPPGDVNHVPAVKRLAGLMEQYGQTQQALQLLFDTARRSEATQNDPELRIMAARLLVSIGRHDEAKRLLAGVAGAPALVPPPQSAPNVVSHVNLEEGYAYLKAIPIFAELSLPDLRNLFRIAEEVIYPPQAVLIERGVEGRGLLVIVSGEVDVLAGDRKLNALKAGAYVGEISLVQDAPTSARVVAKTAVQALFISRENFHHYLENHEAAALRIYRLFTANLAHRVRALSTG